ncbi:MAG: hypothetical protein AAGM67_11905, partial [Bacteroidota bacterium]
TGARSIPKRISTDRPQIVHQSRRQYYQAPKTVFAAAKPVKVETPQPVVSQAESKERAASQNANIEKPAEIEDEKLSTNIVNTDSLSVNEPKRSTEGETKQEESPITKPITVAAVSFPEAHIVKSTSLPVHFEMPDDVRIQFIIKNTKGEVVKKGAGELVAGRHEKYLEMKDLKPGRYQILLKAGEIRKKHVFEVH